MRNKIILSIFLIVTLTFISFSSSLDNNFTNWDDTKFVEASYLIKELSWENTKVIFSTFYREDYRYPLVILSHSLEYHFFQVDPFMYHLNNLILHILNSLFVFYFIFMLSNRVSISLITALLFGVHPLHVEPVAWLSERKGLLSAFFFLQAIIYYLLYQQRNKRFWYYLSLFIFILSLLSKAMAVTLPFVLLLCDYLVSRRFDRDILLEKIPFFVIGCLFGIINLFMYKTTGQINLSRLSSPFENLLLASRGLVSYLIKTILPVNLSAIYPYPDKINIILPEFFSSLIVLLILTVLIFYSKEYTRKIIFGSLFLFVTILPVSKLIPFASGSAAMADRYMYVPSIGLFYMIGLAFHNLYYAWETTFEKMKRVSLIATISIIIAICSILTYQRSNVWQDSETLWKDVIRKYPESTTAHNNLGNIYSEKGLLDKAMQEYRKTLKLNPGHIDARINVGVIYNKKGQPDNAVKTYRKVLKLDPKNALVYYNLGLIYMKKGILEKTINMYLKAISLNPEYFEAVYNLARLLDETGDKKEALRYYKRFMKIVPPSSSSKLFTEKAKKRIRQLGEEQF